MKSTLKNRIVKLEAFKGNKPKEVITNYINDCVQYKNETFKNMLELHEKYHYLTEDNTLVVNIELV